jgi:hypothetical protein
VAVSVDFAGSSFVGAGVARRLGLFEATRLLAALLVDEREDLVGIAAFWRDKEGSMVERGIVSRWGRNLLNPSTGGAQRTKFVYSFW